MLMTFAGMMLVAGCSKDDPGLQVPDTVVDQSLAIFDGRVVARSSVEQLSQPVWKVEVHNAQGAAVLFYWHQEDGSLHRIDGVKGPFDGNYDVVPGQGLINFKSAELAARSALKNSDLREWMLRREDDFNALWVYSMAFNKDGGGEERAFVNASGGEVLALD
jgi:uncharacterized membrane protein YkoI